MSALGDPADKQVPVTIHREGSSVLATALSRARKGYALTSTEALLLATENERLTAEHAEVLKLARQLQETVKRVQLGLDLLGYVP